MRKIKTLIGKSNWHQLKIYGALLLIGVLIESIGLGILFPLFEILISTNKISDFIFIEKIYLSLRFIFNDIRVFSFFLILGIFFFRNSYLLFLSFVKNSFSQNLLKDNTIKLYKIYLSNFNSNLKIPDTNQIKNILTEVPLAGTYITSYIVIITEVGILIAVLAALLYVEIFATSITFLIVGLLSFGIFKLIKFKNYKWASHREKIDLSIYSLMSESLRGKSEINIYNKGDFFISKISDKSNQKQDLLTKMTTLGDLPRFSLEFIAITGLATFSYINIIYFNQDEYFISKTTTMLVGIFKILPSLNKILSSYNQIKFYKTSFEIVFNSFKKGNLPNNNSSSKLSFKKEIQIKGMHFKYRDKIIIDNLNLTIKKGDFIGVKGKSGTGKTTFLKLLIGELKVLKGDIYIDDNKSSFLSEDWRNIISIIPQNHFVFDGSVFENISLENDKNQIDGIRINNLLIDFGLKELDNWISESGSNISGGQAQRLSLIRALYFDREILIFDEPTSALDVHNIKVFIKILKTLKNKTIIIISHDEFLLRDCDKVYEINNGNLIELE